MTRVGLLRPQENHRRTEGCATIAAVTLLTLVGAAQVGPPRGFTIPLVDLASDRARQVIVDREPGRYLGHPTTVLLEDGRKILCAFPKGHGEGAIIRKRSDDGGLTWSDRLQEGASALAPLAR